MRKEEQRRDQKGLLVILRGLQQALMLYLRLKRTYATSFGI